MDIFTYDRDFFKQDEIDVFESAIWTERYYGDGDFELTVPASTDMISKLPKGQLMGCVGSYEPMILETRDIKDGLLKTTGITLTQWLNNRIIRTSSDHKIKEWKMPSLKPGHAMAHIVNMMCCGSDYTSGVIPIGIPVAQTELFVIPGLQVGAIDLSGVVIELIVPFGPVYDALKQIGTTYEIGMKITLDGAFDDYYILQFDSYRGEDRTSSQSVNPVIRFSPEMDSFTNINDLESITDHRNSVYIFAPTADSVWITSAGHATSGAIPVEAGFDLRVFQGFADDISTSWPDTGTLLSLLNQKAKDEIQNHKIVQLVDGEIVQVEDIKYGTDFFLGDVVEVEGNTGILQKARITEYIRSQDKSGERAYPTLSMID